MNAFEIVTVAVTFLSLAACLASYFRPGRALEDLGQESRALEAYEQAIALDPGNADAHYNAASLCERLGRPADALAHLKACRELTRRSPRRGPRFP